MRIKICLLLLILLASLAPPAGAGAPSREYQIKAAFLYNFVQFVEWPADAFAAADSPIILAVVGDNPFGESLRQVIAGKSVGGRRLEVAHFPRAADVDEDDVDQVIRKAQQKAILTVSDVDGFTRAGGVIRFYLDDGKIRFEINVAAAEKSRLKISSRLLKLAKVLGN